MLKCLKLMLRKKNLEYSFKVALRSLLTSKKSDADYCRTPRHGIVIYTGSLTQPERIALSVFQRSKDIQLSAIWVLRANPMCVRWCGTRRMSVWALVCPSKQELGGVRRWPRRARTSQRSSAKQERGRQLTQGLCSGNLLTPTQTHKQAQTHMKYAFQTTTRRGEDVWSRERTHCSHLPPIRSCRNVAMDYANAHVWEVMSDQDQENGWYQLLL